MRTRLLALNAGSSSLKFALFPATADTGPELTGRIQQIGTRDATLRVQRADQQPDSEEQSLGELDHERALAHVLQTCEESGGDLPIAAIGHRVVHGGPNLHQAVRIAPAVLEELARMAPYDPTHQCPALALIHAVARHWPDRPQVACFDTTFHADLPASARLIPIPRDYAKRGVRRYGFHGLSFTFLLGELARLDPTVRGPRRVILAHLGSGSSLAAVRDGACIDTTMGFSPNSGLPMSTRSGELDPAVMLWLTREAGMDVAEIFKMANHHSGLLAVSETSADIRDLLAAENADPRAAEAVALYCYHVKKAIGALAAALGGVDTLVFSGGIGEHAAAVRERVCMGMEFLGLNVERAANAAHSPIISRSNAPVTIRVIPTNEELIIARETRRVLGCEKSKIGR